MRRRLNEGRIGEYRGHLFLNIMYTLLTILGIAGLFIVPITYNGGTTFKELVKQSPINYLIDYGFDSPLGYVSLALIILFSFIFVSGYLSFSLPKLGKSVYLKVTKIIELILLIASFVLLSFSLYMTNIDYIKGALIIYFAWESMLLFLVVLCLFNYFKIKKISIYD